MKSRIYPGIWAVLLFLSSCDRDEDRLTQADTAALTEEATVDSYFQDIDGLGASAIEAPTDEEYHGGRTAGEIVITGDSRFCEGVVVTIAPDVNSTIQHPLGIITVDFGILGCADAQGNVRRGKVFFAYDGWRFKSGSVVTITTQEYSINGVVLEGTRTSTNVTPTENDPPKFHVTLVNGRATFPDNTTATRSADITWSWIRAANPTQDKLVIHSNSTAEGITRQGTDYSVSLLEQLQYNRFCPMAVSGIKKYVIDGEKELSIDYGDGACDKELSVTFRGITRTISIG